MTTPVDIDWEAELSEEINDDPDIPWEAWTGPAPDLGDREDLTASDIDWFGEGEDDD